MTPNAETTCEPKNTKDEHKNSILNIIGNFYRTDSVTQEKQQTILRVVCGSKLTVHTLEKEH